MYGRLGTYIENNMFHFWNKDIKKLQMSTMCIALKCQVDVLPLRMTFTMTNLISEIIQDICKYNKIYMYKKEKRICSSFYIKS